MKTIVALAAFAGLVLSVTGQYFGIMAARSASPIHLQQLTANGERLWIGKDTASFCPSDEVTDCPAGTSTNFGFLKGAKKQGALSMGAEVPGGQQVYIDPTCGAVGYTIAHSASEPEGAFVAGWELDQGPDYGFLGFKSDGLLACSTKGNASEGPWQVYVDLKGFNFGDECLGFDALTINETAADAWEYT